mmetsp:Transcript_18866/g.43505  ORF Transcript_18866/g.43505 Transcript_18866/m.43505 type:complete len:235 (-) Transcript_18866:91-795(-)
MDTPVLATVTRDGPRSLPVCDSQWRGERYCNILYVVLYLDRFTLWFMGMVLFARGEKETALSCRTQITSNRSLSRFDDLLLVVQAYMCPIPSHSIPFHSIQLPRNAPIDWYRDSNAVMQPNHEHLLSVQERDMFRAIYRLHVRTHARTHAQLHSPLSFHPSIHPSSFGAPDGHGPTRKPHGTLNPSARSSIHYLFLTQVGTPVGTRVHGNNSIVPERSAQHNSNGHSRACNGHA